MPPRPILTDFDNPPPFTTPHPNFTGRAKVFSATAHIHKDLEGPQYDVDLDLGTCSCQHGMAWEWHNNQQKWTPYMACSHKIRAMADLIEKHDNDPKMVWEYTKLLALRYNKYEVVSAFHKELRLGNVEAAVYWGSMLMAFRGQKGVYKYLLNILYEECRDHTMGALILDRNVRTQNQNYEDLCRLIKLFCECKKKWQLPHRYEYLEGEMRGYERLVKEYGRAVAGGGNIIAMQHRTKLFTALMEGLARRDLATFQFGLKGLQKSKCTDIDRFRAVICNRLSAALGSVKPAGFEQLEAYIAKRAGNGLGIGYHELNAFADLLTGEPYEAGNTPPERIAAVLAAPAPPLRLGVCPVIPVYAHDNHTWGGKAAIKKYPHEYLPRANQEHMDLRMCGAYMGVVWRALAYKQFEATDVTWGSVEWPLWLGKTVQNLWYTLFVGIVSWHAIIGTVGQLFS